MKEKQIEYRNLIVSILMLGIMALTILSNVLFVHTHISDSGAIYTHSHPFEKKSSGEDSPTHQHSDLDLVLIQNLNIYEAEINLSISLTCKVIEVDKSIERKEHESLFLYKNLSDRAPPALA
jgi:hypothetical protein